MSLFDRWRRWLARRPADPLVGTYPPALRRSLAQLPVLIVVEGRHDAAFLRRISRILHQADPSLPDLPALEDWGAILFLESGGDPLHWAARLAPLRKPELHLIDREEGVDSEPRRAAARVVNSRPGCRAFITRKRSLENYLHPDAICECRGLLMEWTDNDSVHERVARSLHDASRSGSDWAALPYRARRRLRDRAKSWLNTEAVERMTVTRLREQDTHGEVESWLRAVGELLACGG
jgi:hypothetical protein